MLVNETQIRVCYGDTDKMGVVYYGVYPRYYEIGRTEMIRHFGITYKEVEERGILLPVCSLKIDYYNSAYYDDLLTIRTIVDQIPKVKFPIKTEIYNQKGELINKGEVVLVFFDNKTQKPCKAPADFVEAMEKHLKS